MEEALLFLYNRKQNGIFGYRKDSGLLWKPSPRGEGVASFCGGDG